MLLIGIVVVRRKSWWSLFVKTTSLPLHFRGVHIFHIALLVSFVLSLEKPVMLYIAAHVVHAHIFYEILFCLFYVVDSVREMLSLQCCIKI